MSENRPKPEAEHVLSGFRMKSGRVTVEFSITKQNVHMLAVGGSVESVTFHRDNLTNMIRQAGGYVYWAEDVAAARSSTPANVEQGPREAGSQ